MICYGANWEKNEQFCHKLRITCDENMIRSKETETHVKSYEVKRQRRKIYMCITNRFQS